MGEWENSYLHHVECAEDVEPKKLFSYLCDEGPFLCPNCPVPCAYGRRWLAERQEADAEKALDKWKRKARKRAREAKKKNAVPKVPGGQNHSEKQPGQM